jgi:phosphonate transport system substrate-binding protein
MIIPRCLGNTLSLVAIVLLLPQLLDASAVSFKLGSISKAPVSETRKFLPLATYFERQLQSEGISQGKVVVAESISVMSSFLKTRQVDIYIDSFFPAVAVSRLSGSKLLLRRWKMGKGDYRSIIFTRKDSGVARLEDLKGKIIAFEEPFGSASYFFPKVVLLENGLRLVPKKHAIDPVKPDEVGYVFTHGDTNTVFSVMNGEVAAGATDDQKYFTLAKNLDNFNILHETGLFSRQIVSHRLDLPAPLLKRVREILLHMPQTEEGRKALQAFEGTTKFDEIPVRDLELMTRLKKYVDAELKVQR